MEIIHHIGGIRRARTEVIEVLKDYPKGNDKDATGTYYTNSHWIRNALMRAVYALYEAEGDIQRDMQEWVEKQLVEERKQFDAEHNPPEEETTNG